MNGNAKYRSIVQHHLHDVVALMFRALLLIPLVACCNTLTTAAEISKSISIIKSRDSSVYDATIAALDQRLEQRCKPPPQQACLQIETRSFVAGEEPPVPPAQDLVITLGLKAREYADRHLSEEKIINAMVPSGKYRLNESAGNG
ncbi:MAG: hypothetical protein PVI52_10910, partial [Chromatiales bacterium]